MQLLSKLSERKSSRSRTRKSGPRKNQGKGKVSYAALEPRQMLAVVINEFVASNSGGLVNDNAGRSDWIEILNTGNQTINLAGYSLTDDAGDPSKFVFPNQSLAAGQYLVVFADDDADPTSGTSLYTGFGLSSAGEYLGLYDATGTLLSEFAAGGSDYPTQISDVSYGFLNDGTFTQPSYFSSPTPGSANVNPVAEVVQRVTASVTPGFYDAPFNVTLTTPTAGAVVFFTTDGSTPSAFNNENSFSQTSNSITVNISGTTTLRAVAGKSNSLSVADRTWSYLFVDDIVNQNANAPTPDWPAPTTNGQDIDYGIDPDVIGIEGEQAVKDALLAIPSWSITTDVDNLFHPSTGIYTNANNDGVNWERPVSLEQLNPDGSEGFQVNAGIRIRGGFSRSGNNPKHALKFFFRGEYGDSSLEYDLFKDDASSTTSFEKIDLRTAQNYSWSFQGDSSNTFVTDVLNRENQAALGQQATRSTWVHVYLNGVYWGLYQTQERADANFGASYFGGNADNYDVLKPERGPYTNIATDGNFDAYDALYQQALARAADGVTPAFVDNAAYLKAQGLNPDGTDNPNYDTLLDVENLTAYMIVILHGGNFDAPISNFLGNNRINNYFAVRDRTGNEGFRFFVHDSEHTMRNVNENRNGPYNHPNFESGVQYFNPQWLHQQLMANEEYRTQFADKVQEAFFDDGGMTIAAQTARLDAHITALDQAIIAESARWGDAKSSDPLLRSNWVNSVNNLRNFLPERQNVVLGQFENTVLRLKDDPNSDSYNTIVSAPLGSSVDAPDFLINGTPQHGGVISSGDTLELSSNTPTIYYTTDGTDPRLTGGALNPNAVSFTSSTTTTNVFGFGSDWNYEDSGNDLGTAWRASGFNDSSWSSGAGELGYGQPTTDTTISFGSDAQNKHTTTYFRKTFNVSAGTNIAANLSLLRDDGVVVYLNGTEIGRDNITNGTVTFETFADTFIGGTGETTPINFVIPPALLLPGANTLAVEVHQANLTSSDLTFDAQLSVTTQTSPSAPFTFTTSTNVQARTLDQGQWSALNDVTFVIPASPLDLRISEIHYNPADPTPAEVAAGFIDNDDFEFLELFNSSTVGSINLSGVQFSNGVAFNFGDTDLGPGERVVVVEDIDAFMARYGDSATILGEWSGGLNNGGETVTLVDSSLNEIMSVNYGDNDPWYNLTDGAGFSLVLDDPVNTPVAELGKYYRWRASGEFGGTPGTAAAAPAGVVINEILAHTDAPQSDTIELFNPTSQAIDVGLWFLSDSVSSPFKFRIPAGTIIPAGGYLVYDESDFNPNPASPGANDFALSSNGDNVLLSRAVLVAGSVTMFVEDSVSFGATFNGDSLGRSPNGTGRLTRLAANSFGSANASDAKVGPLVISEVNYHPADPSSAALAIDPLLTDNDLEYIEVANPTSSAVDLTNWRLRGESDFDFAAGSTLAAGAALVVVTFDPADALNANKLAAFKTHYGLGAGVTIVGGLNDSLSNSTGRISLQQPDTPDLLGVIPHVVVDELVYDDLAPWANADGSGQVLERDDLSASGALASSWIAADSTPGAFGDDFLIADVNLDGIVNFLDVAPFITVLTANTYQLEADVNQDGVVNFLDISFFIAELSSQ
jgi:hypothetical protein